MMQSLKGLALIVSEKKPTLIFYFEMKKYVNYLPWICANVKESDIFIINLTYLTILQRFNLIE